MLPHRAWPARNSSGESKSSAHLWLLQLKTAPVLFFRFGLKDTIDDVGVTSSLEKEMLRSVVSAVSHIVYLNRCFKILLERQNNECWRFCRNHTFDACEINTYYRNSPKSRNLQLQIPASSCLSHIYLAKTLFISICLGISNGWIKNKRYPEFSGEVVNR